MLILSLSNYCLLLSPPLKTSLLCKHGVRVQVTKLKTICLTMFLQVEAQFQLNRMHFMNMHYALDALADTDIVFPDVTKINPMLNEQHTLRVS